MYLMVSLYALSILRFTFNEFYPVAVLQITKQTQSAITKDCKNEMHNRIGQKHRQNCLPVKPNIILHLHIKYIRTP